MQQKSLIYEWPSAMLNLCLPDLNEKKNILWNSASSCLTQFIHVLFYNLLTLKTKSKHHNLPALQAAITSFKQWSQSEGSWGSIWAHGALAAVYSEAHIAQSLAQKEKTKQFKNNNIRVSHGFCILLKQRFLKHEMT